MPLQFIDNTYYHLGSEGKVTKLSDLALPHLANILKLKPSTDTERTIYENEIIKRAQEQEAKYSSKTKANSKALTRYAVTVVFESDKNLQDHGARIALGALIAVKNDVVDVNGKFQKFTARINTIDQEGNPNT